MPPKPVKSSAVAPHRRDRRAGRRWSAQVTARSNALDLEDGVFKKASAKAIAASLKRSAERSRRRKSDAYRSAMSMLSFFLNRAGRNLPAQRKRILERAKVELRTLFHRVDHRLPAAHPRRRKGR